MLGGCGQSIVGVDHASWDRVVVTELDDAQIIDARTATDFAAGHIPGAVNIHWSLLTGTGQDGLWDAMPPEEIAQVLGDHGIQRDRPVVVYGSGPDGRGDDGNVYWALRWLGHQDVRIYDGGWQAWVATGGDIETQATSTLPGSIGAWAADASQTLDEIMDASVYADTTAVEDWQGTILDVRSETEWLEGHIPGAVWLEWLTVFDDDETLLAPDTVRQILADAGVDGDQPVVTYCHAGLRAGHTFMVLDALGWSATNYVGSWTRWVQDGGTVEY